MKKHSNRTVVHAPQSVPIRALAGSVVPGLTCAASWAEQVAALLLRSADQKPWRPPHLLCRLQESAYEWLMGGER